MIQDAIRTLNTLQIPPEERSLPRLHTNREVGLQMWTRLGFKEEDLNQLNAIHVAGSIGKVYIIKKNFFALMHAVYILLVLLLQLFMIFFNIQGSVSAFCDSILREYGLKTGFIS